MDDLPIVISLDPEPAVTANKKIAAATRETEEAAKKAAQATTSLGEQLARVGRYQQILAGAERKQTAAALGSVRAFDGLTAAIQREQQMLDRLHGPMQRAEQDMQTLESLHRRGAISTKEYVNELTRLGKVVNTTPGGAATSMLPGVGTSNASQLSSIAAGVSKLNVGQIASGVNQAFELVNQKLQITDSRIGSVIGSTVKFGSLGAQVAGPWGAALGGIAGAAVDLFSAFESGHAKVTKDLEEQAVAAKAYWDAIHAAEEKKRVEEEMAPILERAARATRERAESEQTLASVMSATTDAQRHAADAADAYATKLQSINWEIRERLMLEGKIPQTTASRPGHDVTSSVFADYNDAIDAAEAIKASRGLTDAEWKQYAATKSYGDALLDVAQKEESRNRRLEDLAQILGDIDFNRAYPEAGKRLLKEYNDLWRDQHNILKKVSGESRLVKVPIWDMGDGRNAPSVDAISGSRPTGDQLLNGYIEAGDFRSNMKERSFDDIFNDAKQSLGDMKGAFDEAAKSSADLEQHVTSIRDLFAEQLVTAAGSFADTLVDAAFNADVSFKQWGLNTLEMLGKMILRAELLQAITGSATGAKGAAGWGGLIGALGFATGGDALMTTSGLHRIPAAATGYEGRMTGAGPTDSRLAMIRMTPGEFIKVQTPEQRRSDQRPSGGTTVQNVFQYDKRALLPALSSPDGKAAIVNVIRENSEMIRALLR